MKPLTRKLLTGVAWDHSRALPPLVATGQRYEELHPGVEIRWEKRTLDQFGHQPIDELAGRFDLIIIDHPWAGYSFERDLILDLAPLLSPIVRAELERGAVGESFRSYLYDGRLLALPLDAATPVASWRPDLLANSGAQPPATWRELVSLAERGLAVIPGAAADLFLHFVMLCAALDGTLRATDERLASRAAEGEAVTMLRALTRPMPPAIYEWSPILLAEAMTSRDDLAYCAFAYAYHNYARPGFAAHPLRFGPLVRLDGGAPLRSVLGGTGLAISRWCRHLDVALDYAVFTTSAEVQRTLYFLAGGQPAHRAAWEDGTVNALAGGFFRDTRTAHDEALVRPCYSGWVPLQHSCGAALQRCFRDGADPAAALDEIDRRYRASRSGAAPA